MESNVKLFKNDEFGKLEVLIENGKEYFPAKEVAIILGYKDPLKAISTHCKEKGWVIRPVLSNGGKQDKKFIDEGNLYRLIVKSKLPQAEKFEKWVFEEVLPTIRKTGMYFTEDVWNSIMENPVELGKMIIEYGKVREENKKLNITLEEQKSVIEFTDNVLLSENVVTTTVIVKQYGMSARKFNKLLNELGIQYKQSNQWLLYSKYQEKGYTQSVTYADEDTEFTKLNTKWTQKGRKFLYEKLRDNDIVPINEEI